jgi:chromosome segregation ATPase
MSMVSLAPDPTEAFIKEADAEGLLGLLIALKDSDAVEKRLAKIMAVQKEANEDMRRAKETLAEANDRLEKANQAKAEADQIMGPVLAQAEADRGKAAALIAQYTTENAQLKEARETFDARVASQKADLAGRERAVAETQSDLAERSRKLKAIEDEIAAMKSELASKLAKLKEIAG